MEQNLVTCKESDFDTLFQSWLEACVYGKEFEYQVQISVPVSHNFYDSWKTTPDEAYIDKDAYAELTDDEIEHLEEYLNDRYLDSDLLDTKFTSQEERQDAFNAVANSGFKQWRSKYWEVWREEEYER